MAEATDNANTEDSAPLIPAEQALLERIKQEIPTEKLDELFTQCLGRLAYVDVPKSLQKLFENRPECKVKIGATPNNPNLVRLRHAKSYDRVKDQELLPPALAAKLIAKVHPSSLIECRQAMQMAFCTFVLGMPEVWGVNLGAAFKGYRGSTISLAKQRGGIFNIISFRTQFFFQKSQILPKDQLPPEYQAEEHVEEIEGSFVTVNVGGLKGARQVSDRSVLDGLKDYIRDAVYFTVDELLLICLLPPNHSPIMSGLAPFSNAEGNQDVDRTNFLRQRADGERISRCRALLVQSAVEPVYRACLASNPARELRVLPCEKDAEGVCFLCSRPTEDFLHNQFLISSIDFSQPLIPHWDSMSTHFCTSCVGKASKVWRAITKVGNAFGPIAQHARNGIVAGYLCKNAACPNNSVAKASMLRCSRCKTAWYCSTTCQSADWSKHKAECGVGK